MPSTIAPTKAKATYAVTTLNLPMKGLRAIANLPKVRTPVVRFQHSYSFSTGSFANIEIKGPLENIGFQWSFVSDI
jgi:hypothetical protein